MKRELQPLLRALGRPAVVSISIQITPASGGAGWLVSRAPSSIPSFLQTLNSCVRSTHKGSSHLKPTEFRRAPQGQEALSSARPGETCAGQEPVRAAPGCRSPQVVPAERALLPSGCAGPHTTQGHPQTTRPVGPELGTHLGCQQALPHYRFLIGRGFRG